MVGLVIGCSIGITATTYVLQANEIEYKNNKSVQEAIEELYTMAQNSGGSTETLPIGTPNVVSYTVTVPYTGSYTAISCVYRTTESYGSTGTISGNTCRFTGTAANQTLYYKIVGADNAGKVYENSGSAVTENIRLVSTVNIGDYIYMKPTSTGYSITSDMTGCTSSGSSCNSHQTINPSELTVWRVIRKNSDGTVDVVSENVSSTYVYFGDRTGYQNLVGSLNTIAAQYTNSDYVQSTRHMGYDGTATGYITNTSKLTDTRSRPWTSSTSASTTSTDEALGAGDMGYETDYNLVQTALGTRVATNPSGTVTRYWLASRYYSSGSSGSWNFFGRYIEKNGSLQYPILFYYDEDASGSGWDYSSQASPVRPILTLKSTVKIVGGTGKQNDNYQLGV